MNGIVSIIDLKVRCIIGIHPFEREKSQDLFFDIHMETDFSEAASSENIEKAVDYSSVSQVVEDFSVKGKFLLIETLAHKLLDKLLNEFPAIQNCEVVIKKPAAVPKARHAKVSLKRNRN